MLVASLLAVGLGLLALVTGFTERAENATVDARFSIRGDRSPPADLAVIGIDDRTFQALDRRWPFPRSLHGSLLDRLRKAGVDAVVYDIQFTEPTVPREDNALILAVARTTSAGIPVILATEEVDARGRTGVFGGGAVLARIGARAANSTFEPDPGGVWRRELGQAGGLETLAVATVEERDRREVDTAGFPADGALIDFFGSPGTIPTYSFSDVVEGKVGRAELAGKTVVVGATAPSLQDVHAVSTSADGFMPGAEVVANSISTVAGDLPLEEAPWPLALLIVFAFGATVPLVALGDRIRFGILVVSAVGAGIAYLAICQVVFGAGLVLPVVAPLVALVVSLVGAVAVRYTVEAFERQRVRDTFARFVPLGVVDEVLRLTDSDLRVGAERRECSVLFSDIRGFTTFSEGRPPDEVVGILNRYLEEMTDTIMEHGGSVVSYLGDGILAVFGAPLEQPDHADRAVAAARAMVGAGLDRFNEWARSEGMTEGFRMGVGVNTGPLMFGQVGSERRVEFTVIGDTVNTASRLEGMTKGSGHDVFISDSTRTALGEDGPAPVEVGEMEVKGRSGKVRVWAVPSRGLDRADR